MSYELEVAGRDLIQVPSVVLTQRAFMSAHEAGITDIAPNPEVLQAIGEITQTAMQFAPDITVMRAFGRTPAAWEKEHTDVPDRFRYFPASELAATERGLQIVSAGNIGRPTTETGKTVLNLAVKDWDHLGDALAETIEEAKTQGKSFLDQGPELVINAILGIGGDVGSSPAQMRRKRAAELQPYYLTRPNR